MSRWGILSLLALAACGRPYEGKAPPADAHSADGWTADLDLAPPPPPPSSAAPPREPPGRDFTSEAKILYRVVACAGEMPLPAGLDAKIIDEHCRAMKAAITTYQTQYVAKMAPFLASVVPSWAPRTVVYPFSGGDLMTALLTYPTAAEITTVSLELAGDPRRIAGLSPDALQRSLASVRREVFELLLGEEYSRSETLKRTQRGDIPGELSMFLVGLAAHGYAPVSMRYFRLAQDGSIRYVTDADIEAFWGRIAEHRKQTWTPPDFSEAFANVEIRYQKAGSTDEPRVHRHVAQNLADDPLGKSELLLHLMKKGRIAGMTKAASYLLWQDAFSLMRGYLAKNVAFMISDSTGIPPAFAAPEGLTQETYGAFKGSLLRASGAHNADLRALWAAQPKRELPARYGYLDSARQPHLIVTKRVSATPPPAP